MTCDDDIAQDALDECIDKWEEVVEGKVASRGSKNCVLCHVFKKNLSGGLLSPVKCDGCPVKTRTGKDGCEDTPYPRFLKYMTERQEASLEGFLDIELPEDVDGYPLVFDERSRELAQEELDFLIRLRVKLPG